MFVYHFIDPDLRVEIIFRKKTTAENGEIDFEIVDIGTSAHWYYCMSFFWFPFKDKTIWIFRMGCPHRKLLPKIEVFY